MACCSCRGLALGWRNDEKSLALLWAGAAGVGPAVPQGRPGQTGRAQALGLKEATQSPLVCVGFPCYPHTYLHGVISSPSVCPPWIHLGSKHQAKEEEKPLKLLGDQSPPALDSSPSFHCPRVYLYAKLVDRMSSKNRFLSPIYKTLGKKCIPSVWAYPHWKRKMNMTGGPTDFGKCHYFNASKWSALKSLNSYKFAIYLLIRYTGLFTPVKPMSTLHNKNIFQFTSSKEEIPCGWKVL